MEADILVLDSPFAASVLGNLDCKKAAISLSSSLSLWRRIFNCFLFVWLNVTKATAGLTNPQDDGMNSLLHAHNLLLNPFPHARRIMKEDGLSRTKSKCHSQLSAYRQ